MKLLFDQNVSHELVNQFALEFPGSRHVRDLALSRSDDEAIWEHAKQHGFVIFSKDSDFRQRSFVLGHPPKVIWLRLGNCSTDAIARALRSSSALIAEFGAHAEASFLVLP